MFAFSEQLYGVGAGVVVVGAAVVAPVAVVAGLHAHGERPALATVQLDHVALGLFAVGEEAGGFDHHVHAQLPGQLLEPVLQNYFLPTHLPFSYCRGTNLDLDLSTKLGTTEHIN